MRFVTSILVAAFIANVPGTASAGCGSFLGISVCTKEASAGNPSPANKARKSQTEIFEEKAESGKPVKKKGAKSPGLAGPAKELVERATKQTKPVETKPKEILTPKETKQAERAAKKAAKAAAKEAKQAERAAKQAERAEKKAAKEAKKAERAEKKAAKAAAKEAKQAERAEKKAAKEEKKAAKAAAKEAKQAERAEKKAAKEAKKAEREAKKAAKAAAKGAG